MSEFKRDEKGLLPGIQYIYNDDKKSVNWRAMVKPEYLVPNKQRTQETDVTKLEDKDLIILLHGLKELADLRGYKVVDFDVKTAQREFVSTKCVIEWLPNFEKGGESIKFASTADAHFENTEGFGQKFLTAIAENRAFARCIRNFLKINIVSQEELSKEEPQENAAPQKPEQILTVLMEKAGISFEQLKEKLIAESFEGAELLESVSDIPKMKIYELTARIDDAIKKKKK